MMKLRLFFGLFLALGLGSDILAQETPISLLGWVEEALPYIELGGEHNLGDDEGAKIFFKDRFKKNDVEMLYQKAEYVWDTVSYHYLIALWNVYKKQDIKAARKACYAAGVAYLNAKGTEQYAIEKSGLSFDHIKHLREYLDHGEHKSTDLLGFDSGTQTDVNGYVGFGVDKVDIPSFPWPPPRASTKWVLPERFFKDANTLAAYDERLLESLEDCGYEEISYFSLPSGFVLVTRIERYKESEGTPYEGIDRWNESLIPSTFSFSDYFSALFWGRKGYYRVIAFIVTDKPFTTSPELPQETEVKEWLDTGGNMLPESIGNQSSRGFRCTALIYEFELKEQLTEPKFLKTGKVSAKKHIQKTGICTNK